MPLPWAVCSLLVIPSVSRIDLFPLPGQVYAVRCYFPEEIPLLRPQNLWAWFTVMHISEKRLNTAIEKVLSLCGSYWGLLCASAEMEMSDLQNLWREIGSPVPGRSSIIVTAIIPLFVFIGSLEFLLDFPEAAICLLSLVGIVH